MAVDLTGKAPDSPEKGKARPAPEAPTLIDLYACAGLTGILANPHLSGVASGPDTAAAAFRYALAMKNERSKLLGQF